MPSPVYPLAARLFKRKAANGVPGRGGPIDLGKDMLAVDRR